MKKNLRIEGAISVGALPFARFPCQRPGALFPCLVVASALILRGWHERNDVLFYIVGFVLGPVGEMMAVHSGARGGSI